MTARDRGQAMAIEILRLFVMLVLAGLLLIMLQDPFNTVNNKAANATTNSSALQGVTWMDTIWSNLPVFFLFVGGMGVIVVSVFLQRRV